jgi:trehalose 6-phosphate synthase/phosphatase
MTPQDFLKIKRAYLSSPKRLFFLDLEGTLVSLAAPATMASQIEGLSKVFLSLASDPGNDVIVISKKSQEKIDNWFNDLPITLVAENGGFCRRTKGQWQNLSENVPSWKGEVHRALIILTEQYPGSSIESNFYSLIWRYESTLVRITETEKRQLQVALRSIAKQHDVILHDDNHVVEFTSQGITKGRFAAHWVATHGHYDFIMAIGDDASDEDLFEAVGKNYVTIKVGDQTKSSAQFNLGRQEGVLPFLVSLAALEQEQIFE